MRFWRIKGAWPAIVLALLLIGVGLAADGQSPAAPQLKVAGNELVAASGTQFTLRGVDRSGTEYECVQGYGIFAGPADQASVTAMKSWGINAVRLPLNEDCWNGESNVKAAYSGKNYRTAIENYVHLLNANGMVVILDLHWSDGRYTGAAAGCSSAQARCQTPMPDSAHALPFWTSVAETFKGNDAVIFDLFNEPYPDRVFSSAAVAWRCWANGGAACRPGISYPVAGMQTLVSAVRRTGANNVLMLGGLAFSNNLTRWLRYRPADPDRNLVASWHSYNFNRCSTRACWTRQIAPVIKHVPVVAGEIGASDCSAAYITSLMTWLDSRSASYLAWSWNPGGRCVVGASPRLIADDAGAATAYGAVLQSHLLSVGG